MKKESVNFEVHGHLIPVVKRGEVLRGLRIALADLKLERIAVVFPGRGRYSLADRVSAVPLGDLTQEMSGLFPDF